MDHLREQIQFLLLSTESYDKGITAEAKRLATVIRVLVHTTPKSTSLLNLLNKEKIKFYTTSTGIDKKTS